MNNNQSFDNEEITVDLRKIWNIVKYRKKVIFSCFLIMIFLACILTLILPKKYIAEGKILIDKSSSTNIAEINPFIISDVGSKAGGVAGIISGASGGLNDEIEIMKSPLVLEPVIIANNLKYTSGPKDGMYLSVASFLKQNVSIDNLKGSNIITISYTSKDPVLSYNVVNSIIENYKKIYEKINSRKAMQDSQMLKKAYSDTKAAVDMKIAKLKRYNLNNAASEQSVSGVFGLLANYDRRIKNQVASSTQASIDNQNIKSDIEQSVAQLNDLKQKYEWSNLVQDISKNATNVVILAKPVQKMPFEFSEPNLLINIVISIVLAFILSIFLILYFEKTDKKLTFSDVGDNADFVNKSDTLNTLGLSAGMFTKQIGDISMIGLVRNSLADEFTAQLKSDISGLPVHIKQTFAGSRFNENLENIKNSSAVIFLGQIGYSDRKIYNNLKTFAEKAGKQIIGEFVFSKNYINQE